MQDLYLKTKIINIISRTRSFEVMSKMFCVAEVSTEDGMLTNSLQPVLSHNATMYIKK